MELYLKRSPALKKIKKKIGNANHLIITLLVALNVAENTPGIIVPNDLRTSWNPKNKTNSINQSRIFLINSILNRAVDAFDLYVALSKEKPCLFRDIALIEELNENKNRTSKKAEIIFKYFDTDKKLAAFMMLIIDWRNKEIHSNAPTNLSPSNKKILKDNEEWYKTTFCNLDINKLLDNYNKKNSVPTLKEITSIFRCIHMIIEDIDAKGLKKFESNVNDKDMFLKECVVDYLKLNVSDNKNISKEIKMKLSNIWGKAGDNKQNCVQNLLINCGYTNIKDANIIVTFEESIIDNLLRMTTNEVYSWCEDII